MFATPNPSRIACAWSRIAGQFTTGCLRALVFLAAVTVGWLIGEAVNTHQANAAESLPQPASITEAVASPVDTRAASAAPALTDLLPPKVEFTEPANRVLADASEVAERGSSLGSVLHPLDVSAITPSSLNGPNEAGSTVENIDATVVNNAASYGPNQNAVLVHDKTMDSVDGEAPVATLSDPVPTGYPAAVPAAEGGAVTGPQTGANAFTAAMISEYVIPETSNSRTVNASQIAPVSSWLLADPSFSPD